MNISFRDFVLGYVEENINAASEPMLKKMFPHAYDKWVDIYDPTPYCHICNADNYNQCNCGPMADNE